MPTFFIKLQLLQYCKYHLEKYPSMNRITNRVYAPPKEGAQYEKCMIFVDEDKV